MSDDENPAEDLGCPEDSAPTLKEVLNLMLDFERQLVARYKRPNALRRVVRWWRAY